MRKYLSPPETRSARQQTQPWPSLRTTPTFDPGSHSMARSGDAVVIRDRRVPPTQLALYDMRTGELARYRVAASGANGQRQEHTALEYVFNDTSTRFT